MTAIVTGRDYYQVLGVARDAAPEEIRTAYVRLARRHHPDVDGDLPGRLHDVQQAYRCLSDAEARTRHDRAIAEGERLHLARQRRVRQRLGRYDRHHPRLVPRPRRRLSWRRLLVLALGLLVLARVSTDLLG